MTPLIEQAPQMIAFFVGLGMGIVLGLLIAFTAVRNIARRRAQQASNNTTKERPNGK